MTFEESSCMELKESYSNTFLKSVSAFANEGEGKIIFGVNDKGIIVGCEDCAFLRLRIENAINDSVSPIPKFTLKEEETSGKKIIVLTVHKGLEAPYFYKSKAYQRSDTASIPADMYQVRRWIMESSNVSYDKLMTDDVGFEFTKLEQAFISKLGVEKMTPDMLRTMGLMVGSSYTNAGKLFADENDMSRGCDAVKFGSNISEFIKRKTVTKTSVLEQFYQIESFFDEFYYDYEKISNGRRIKRVMIPRDAFREALANAIVHQDYLIPAKIRIEFWDDYIKITSPGGLPNGLTEEQFQQGNLSILRNEIIASVFQRLGIIETFATGVQRIRDLYLEYAENPKFEVIGNSISVTLPKVNYQRKGTQDARIDLILNFLSEEPRTRSEIQVKLSLGRTQTNEHIAFLSEIGVIEKIGAGPATKYKLSDEK